VLRTEEEAGLRLLKQHRIEVLEFQQAPLSTLAVKFDRCAGQELPQAARDA